MQQKQTTSETMKNNWKKYTIEFLSIFIAVISAFALNNWNDNRRDNNAESKILTEILNGLELDKQDVQHNILGHEHCIKSGRYWRSIINGEVVSTDSIWRHYFLLTRDFISIQNTSGYETLKSRGFELIKKDSLRAKIISLYEFDYQTLEKLEEQYSEMQFHESYYNRINEAIAPNFKFDPNGEIVGMKLPLKIEENERKVLLSYLWKIEINRKFTLEAYREVDGKIGQLMEKIKSELNR